MAPTKAVRRHAASSLAVAQQHHVPYQSLLLDVPENHNTM